MPTWLLKQSIDVVSACIINIVNQSLSDSSARRCFKHSNVTPLLKKPNLDMGILKNYRPVSNLSFVSKVVEKVVLKRLLDHMSTNALQECYQSVYKQYHCTETALLNVQSVEEFDRKIATELIMWDLSGVFDVIDHEIRFDRLRYTS